MPGPAQGLLGRFFTRVLRFNAGICAEDLLQVSSFPGKVHAKCVAIGCESLHPSNLLSALLCICDIFLNEQMPGPKAPEHHTCRLLLISRPPNPSPPPLSIGGIHVVNHYDPGICKDRLGLQRCVAQRIQTMPAGPYDTKRTRSSLVAGGGVVDICLGNTIAVLLGLD